MNSKKGALYKTKEKVSLLKFRMSSKYLIKIKNYIFTIYKKVNIFIFRDNKFFGILDEFILEVFSL